MEEGRWRKEGGGGRRYKENFYGRMRGGRGWIYFGENWTLHEENEEEKYLRRGTTQG